MASKEPKAPRPFIDTRVPARGAENKKWLEGRMKWPTGHCNENGLPGAHEGTKPKDVNGRPMMTCSLWRKCPCACHKRLDDMFALAGLERVEVPNPDFRPPVASYVLPEVTVADPLGRVDIAAEPMEHAVAQRPSVTPPSAPEPPLAQRRTETGRAAKGGLEAQVWDACRALGDTAPDAITPRAVGEWIAEKYKVPTPSSGAINAVWDRWTKLGFAAQAKKPNRFVEFTGDSTWEYLARLKGASKRNERNTKLAERRGFRRPA